jgi:hypothetical protein
MRAAHQVLTSVAPPSSTSLGSGKIGTQPSLVRVNSQRGLPDGLETRTRFGYDWFRSAARAAQPGFGEPSSRIRLKPPSRSPLCGRSRT